MSPKCQVKSLHELSLSLVAKQLVDTLASIKEGDDITFIYVVIKSYYEDLGATGDIYQDLVNLIMKSEYLEPSARLFALQLLLHENVKMLATGIFPEHYYEKILQTIINEGTGLTALNLKGVWVRDQQLPLLYDLIKSLTQLNILNIPHMANDEILKYIGKHSKNMKMLDVSGETDITEIGIYSMVGFDSIKETLSVVNIGLNGEENVCHTDVALLIAHLPNLINLGCYSFVGKSIAHLVKTKQCPANFQSKLKYIHDTETSKETAGYIVKMCPMIETIYFDQPGEGVISFIEKMDNINRIKLTKFRCHEFQQVIERIGEKIQSFMLSMGTGSLNFTHIASKCPNLLMMECFKMDILTHEEEIKFEQLEHIDILYSEIRTSTFKYLMTSSPKLKKIVIVDEIKMSDADMIRMLRTNNFENLEGIWFPHAPLLTNDTVEVMLETCPKLQTLGQFCGWSITPDDMMLLGAIIESTNTDIMFHL